MRNGLHSFHIPVMGTGYTVDTPIRLAHFGISSVISIVDDFLLEKVRKYYCRRFGFSYVPIPNSTHDSRAKRITSYLDMVEKIVNANMDALKKLPFFQDNDKRKYFELLPDDSHLKREYQRLIEMKDGDERDALCRELNQKLKPGAIDVNIMVKVDKTNYDAAGSRLEDKFNDAKAALRGFADSTLASAVVFSAGINKSLFSYMTRFSDFYRDRTGAIRKKIILKVSDFRSAAIQGKFLARKGLEVHEYRIESGLNCGGHAFATNGFLLPCVIREFNENLESLALELQKTVKQYYESKGWNYSTAMDEKPLVTVQGGVGTFGEAQRLKRDFSMDCVGWASPFLLVPEATCVDDTTRKLLKDSEKSSLYVSNISPYGIPFNNIRNSGSQKWTQNAASKGNPGSSCPKRLLVSNTEFSENPICVASSQYQQLKLKQIQSMDITCSEKERLSRDVTEKTCLCSHLANSSLIALGIAEEKHSPQLICPGPNIEWFTSEYTLKQMVDHIYGRGSSLVSHRRPHMFAKELTMYVDAFEKKIAACTGLEKEIKMIREFKDNLRKGMAVCMEIADMTPYPGENLESLKTCVEKESRRTKSLYLAFKRKMKLRAAIREGVSSATLLTPSIA